MKRTFNLTIILTLITSALLFNACNSRQPKDNGTDLLAAANELDSLFLVAFNNGDAEALMKLYWSSPELRAYFPADEKPLMGFDAVKASTIRDFATNKGARLEYTSSQNDVYKDVVIGHGTFKITMQVEGGDPMIFNGRFTEVKTMKDGKLVIVVDHASMPMAPAPVEEMPTGSTKAK